MILTETASELRKNSAAAAHFLRVVGNHRRLMVLCLLLQYGEMSVGDILQHVDLSQSALSQHLAKMREDNLVEYRRETQTLYYRIADARVIKLMQVLKEIFCDPSQ